MSKTDDGTRVLSTRTKEGDVLTMLLKVQDAMARNGETPDVGPFLSCTDPEKNWFDPRNPLATDVWRALAGLSLKYHGDVPKEIADHAEHGRKFFGGHPCLCHICMAYRAVNAPP